jgi:RNA ligase (TIGR02306 family)
MTRSLVTIRTISCVRPIPGADAIECATVDGWDVVVKKGEFQIGDRGVYFEIDSFLPTADERFSFLAKSGIREMDGCKGMRLKTIKLRGQISQGLLLPLSLFPEIFASGECGDLASVVGVQKWEPPIQPQLAGQMKGGFPFFIQKTDQERIQNMPEILTEQADEEFEVTVKLNGTSMTVYYQDGSVGVCGRNIEFREGADNTYWRVACRDNLPVALCGLNQNLAIQGELIGPGIQGNPEKLRDHEFYIFDVFDIVRGQYLSRVDRMCVVDRLKIEGADLKTVPLVGFYRLNEFHVDVHKVLDLATGPSLNPNVQREGVVFKRVDGRCSFKAISNTYLLKSEAAA